jgi:hypothetical protein
VPRNRPEMCSTTTPCPEAPLNPLSTVYPPRIFSPCPVKQTKPRLASQTPPRQSPKSWSGGRALTGEKRTTTRTFSQVPRTTGHLPGFVWSVQPRPQRGESRWCGPETSGRKPEAPCEPKARRPGSTLGPDQEPDRKPGSPQHPSLVRHNVLRHGVTDNQVRRRPVCRRAHLPQSGTLSQRARVLGHCLHSIPAADMATRWITITRRHRMPRSAPTDVDPCENG